MQIIDLIFGNSIRKGWPLFRIRWNLTSGGGGENHTPWRRFSCCLIVMWPAIHPSVTHFLTTFFQLTSQPASCSVNTNFSPHPSFKLNRVKMKKFSFRLINNYFHCKGSVLVFNYSKNLYYSVHPGRLLKGGYFRPPLLLASLFFFLTQPG